VASQKINACIGENTLGEFVEGTLSAARRAGVEAHIAECASCRAVLSELGRSSAVRDAVPDADLQPRFVEGEVLAGRYQVVRFLAAGGMGEVYEADDVELRTRVAIKVVRAEIAADPRAIDRLKREIHLARRVTHPNVCRIFDVGFLEGTPRVPFLTMELLDGETLSDWLAGKVRLDPDEALPIAQQLADALTAAHEAGIVHRDFKSANIMLVERDGKRRAVVTDFGVARATKGSDFARTTASGARGFVGSPGYMAPEQVEGREATPAADVYAFGVVLYEMMTGKLPYAEATPLLTALRRLEEAPTPPSVHVPELDPQWQHVILKCLQRDPARRYPSAKAVLDALFEVAQEPERHVGFWIGAAASLILVAGAVTFIATRKSAPATASAPASARAAVSAPAAAAAPAAAPATAPAAPAATAPAAAAAPVAAPAPPADPRPAVIIRSDPPGATVLVDGKATGTTPALLRLALPQEVTLELEGYRLVREVIAQPGETTVHLVARRRAHSADQRFLDE
jgi:hypothetical protein